jgi:hypothetical protein
LVLGVAAVIRHLELPTGFAMRVALIAALLDTIGNVAMLLALRERVHRLQVVGMALALVSVAMIAGG